jgi:lycopene beta-cyclase
MTYAGFLLIFVCIPSVLLALIGRRWLRREHWLAIGVLMAIALIYTTPWDNYLVANRVWWYHTELVTGIVIGWVPIEEYSFFVLQPLMVGLWLIILGRHQGVKGEFVSRTGVRWLSVAVLGVLWLIMLLLLISGWGAATYLSIMLVWGLPPLILQAAAGADILWHHRKEVTIAIGSATLWLSAADALAIRGGIWTIAPDQSLKVYLGGVLPIEEFIFFLLTNTLVTVGVALILSADMRKRLKASYALIRSFRGFDIAAGHRE